MRSAKNWYTQNFTFQANVSRKSDFRLISMFLPEMEMEMIYFSNESRISMIGANILELWTVKVKKDSKSHRIFANN